MDRALRRTGVEHGAPPPKPPPHVAVAHRSALRGVEAVSLDTAHAFPRHAHDGFGIGVMLAGAQASWSGIGAVEATVGDVIAVNPGEMHDGRPLGCERRAWRMLYLDPGVVAAWTAHENLAGEPEMARPALRDPALAGLVLGLLARVTETVPETLAVEEGLLALLVHALGRHGARPPRPTRLSPGIARARRRLDEAPEEPVTLAELAGLAGASRFQLLRGFRRELGVTPHAYQVQRRVRLARALLAAGEAPAGAALRAGFADQSHLTRTFVRQFGLTPGRYRAALA